MISDDNLRHISDEMKNARNEYSTVIKNQFKQWSLTPSDSIFLQFCDVISLLMSSPKGEYLIKSKGLSFREISSVRIQKKKLCDNKALLFIVKRMLKAVMSLPHGF